MLQDLVAVMTGRSTYAQMLSALTETGGLSGLCELLSHTGCCAQSFLAAAQATLTMTCHALTAQNIGALAAQCPKPLPTGCSGYKAASFEPPRGCPIASGILIPAAQDDCGIPPGACPQNACQWVCAVATNDPPAGTAGFTPAAVAGALATGQGTPTPLGVALMALPGA